MNADSYGRSIEYLRISVTDRCNERCSYCMPEGYKGWADRKDLLSCTDILRIAFATTALGFRKFRLTGGEPLIREDIVEIAGKMWNLPGVEDLAVSTNGTRLKQMARPLRQAGVQSINISIDALDAGVYHRVTGGRLQEVVEGIGAAKDAGFERIKLNCVLMRGVTENQAGTLLDFARENDLPLRFIELMPLSHADSVLPENFLSIAELKQILGGEENLEPVSAAGLGHGPARYFQHRSSGALVGFIGALTERDFCGSCNKLRLTADGRLRPCLGQHGEMNLRPILQKGTDGDLLAAFQEVIRQKPLDHSFRENYQPSRPMIAIGG